MPARPVITGRRSRSPTTSSAPASHRLDYVAADALSRRSHRRHQRRRRAAADRHADRSRPRLSRPPDRSAVRALPRFLARAADRGSAVETIRVGRADQIVLRRERARISGVEIRNVAANGDGLDRARRRGDARSFRRWSRSPPRIGRRRTCAASACASATADSISSPAATCRAFPTPARRRGNRWRRRWPAPSVRPTSTSSTITARSIRRARAFWRRCDRPVLILPSWSATHPSQDALKRMMAARLYPGPRDIFATLLRGRRPRRASGSRADQLKAEHGHIVVPRRARGRQLPRVRARRGGRPRGAGHSGVFGPYRRLASQLSP